MSRILRALLTRSAICVAVMMAGWISGQEAPKPAKAPELKRAHEVQVAAENRYQGDTDRRKLTLVLTNKRGEVRESKLVRYRKKQDGLWRTLLSYTVPADVRGTSTLTIERKKEDDLQRIYLPSLKKVRRIPQADKSKSWAGTDFAFEDLQEHDPDDFNYSEMDIQEINGHPCYHYTQSPKDPETFSYGKLENWIRKDILHPEQTKYYDKKGQYIKILYFNDIRQIDGIWTCFKLEMESLLDKHKTLFVTDKIVYNKPISDDMYTERGMLDVPEEIE